MSQICHINLFSGDNWQKVDIWPLFQTQWKETGHHKQGIKENFKKQLREVISTDEWCFYANYPFLPCPPPHPWILRFFVGRQKLHLRLWRNRILMIDGSNDDYDGAEAAKCCRRNISFEMASLLRKLSKSLDPINFGQVGSFSFVCSPGQPILPLLRASWQQKQLRSLPWQFGSGQAALSGQEIL